MCVEDGAGAGSARQIRGGARLDGVTPAIVARAPRLSDPTLERSTRVRALGLPTDRPWFSSDSNVVVFVLRPSPIVEGDCAASHRADRGQKNCSSISDFPGGCVVRIDGALLCHRCLYVVYEGI